MNINELSMNFDLQVKCCEGNDMVLSNITVVMAGNTELVG